jgi:hypothetical protein
MAALLSACAARTREVPLPRDTLWYISARARDERGRDRREIADALEYGAVIFERTPVNDPFVNPLRFTRRDSLRLTRTTFLAAVGTRVRAQRAPDDFAVFYVHGFGTGLDECFSHPVHARSRSLASAPWVAFCWPSHGSGITWPRVGSIVVRAYEEDTAALTASAPAFRHALRDVTTSVGAEHVLLAAHSLGGRLVSEALAQDARDGVWRDTLRALAFLAPDHDAARFGDTLLPILRGVAHRRVLYTSRRDRALTISRRMHDTPRAGLAEPTPLVRDGLETVDVTDALAADGWLQRLVGNRHSIRRASGLLWDLTHLVGRGLEPACRDTLRMGARDTTGAWHLRALPPPDSSALIHCLPSASSVSASPAPVK